MAPTGSDRSWVTRKVGMTPMAGGTLVSLIHHTRYSASNQTRLTGVPAGSPKQAAAAGQPGPQQTRPARAATGPAAGAAAAPPGTPTGAARVCSRAVGTTVPRAC